MNQSPTTQFTRIIGEGKLATQWIAWMAGKPSPTNPYELIYLAISWMNEEIKVWGVRQITGKHAQFIRGVIKNTFIHGYISGDDRERVLGLLDQWIIETRYSWKTQYKREARTTGEKVLAENVSSTEIQTLVGYPKLHLGTNRETPKTHSKNWLSIELAQSIIDSIPLDNFEGARQAAVFGLLVGCGLRRAEVCWLKWGNLRQKAAWVQSAGGGMTETPRIVLEAFVAKGKWENGVHRRSVPVPDWASKLVLRYKRYSDNEGVDTEVADGPMFYRIRRDRSDRMFVDMRESATHLIEGSINRIVAEIIDNAIDKGVDVKAGITPHDLRRTFAQLALRGGAELIEIGAALGHKSPTTTAIYLGMDKSLDMGTVAVNKTGLKS